MGSPALLGRGQKPTARRVWTSRLVAAVLFAAIVAGLASAEASAQATTRQELVQRFEVRGTTGAAFLATYTSYVLDHERTLAQQLLATPTVSDAQFASFLNIFGFGSAVLLDGEGRDLDVVPYDASIIGTDLAGHYAHLASAVAGRPAVSNVVASAAQHVPIVAFATPFATAYGRRVVSGAFDLTAEPMGLYLQHVLPYADGATFLVDGSDQVIASSTRQTGPLASIDGPLARAVTNTRSFGYYRPAAGGDAVYATARIAGTPWKLVLSVPSATLFAPISETARLLPWLLLVAFAIAGTGLLLLLARTRQARVAADRAARTDLLTAVPNRRAAFESLTRLVADRSRYGHSLGVLLIDVDHFKDINDALGHAGGDDVLKQVVERVEGCLRANDLIGRWGGEEFVVLLPHTQRVGLSNAAERIRHAVASGPAGAGARKPAVTVSIGGAVARADDDPDRLLSRADAALYTAKETGRNRSVIADDIPAPGQPQPAGGRQ